MPKVFISHSNQDSEETLFIADSLRRAGIDVWVDFENIRGGADWLCEIQAGIQRCDAVVIVLSKSSANSVWVERECLYAWQLRKPVLTALVDDILIPLHLINIQYCDLRARRKDGISKLVASIEAVLQSNREAEPIAVSTVSRKPAEGNFFPYVEQLADGDIATLVARDLFHWSRSVAHEVAFGGVSRPGFHARVKVNRQLATVFSVYAFRRRPSAQIPLDRLTAHKPFNRRKVRTAIVRDLNRILPKKQRFKADKANRRPTLALVHLSDADKLEAFKSIVLEIISELRAAEGTA